jgi:hypothetical protein
VNAAELKEAIASAGVSQRRAARELGINERTMRRYIAGAAVIPQTVAMAIELLVIRKGERNGTR